MLSACCFALCEVCNDLCCSLQPSSALSAAGRWTACKEYAPFFSSGMFHVIRMKTGWESGAVTVVFFFFLFPLCMNISEKRWGFLVGCCYPWWVWTMVCSCQRGQAIPSAYFASLVLSPFIPAMTTENKPIKNKLENGQGELCCSSEEENGSLQAETDARAGLRLISRIMAFLWQ